MSKELHSFPELVFHLLKLNDNRPLGLADLILKAFELESKGEIKLKIESGYEKYSKEWEGVLVSGITREASENAKIHEGKERIFIPAPGSSSAGPWTLCEVPYDGEEYGEFRRRLRGSEARTTSSGAKRKKYGSGKGKSTPVNKKDFEMPIYGDFLGKITADNTRYGSSKYTIYVYEYGIQFKDSNNMIHRDPDEGPAIFDWREGAERVVFYINGAAYNYHGPAERFKEDDGYNDRYYNQNNTVIALQNQTDKVKDAGELLGWSSEEVNKYTKGNYDKDDCFKELDKWRKLIDRFKKEVDVVFE